MPKITQIIDNNLFGEEPEMTPNAFTVGKNYFIRTATYFCTGKLVAIYPQELVLETAAWIADTGRFNEALRTGNFHEVEPFVEPIIVNRMGIIDATHWTHPLPTSVK